MKKDRIKMYTVQMLYMLLSTLLSYAAHAQPIADTTYISRGDSIVAALHTIERSADHLWQHAGWWNAANIFEANLDHQRITGVRDSAWCRRIYDGNKGMKNGNFQNDYYDDNAWWALAWIKAFDLYHEVAYIRTAEQICADMQLTGYDALCGGGMAWHRTKRYKNAITSELYILLCARLAERQTNPQLRAKYLKSSLDTWHWFKASGMINQTHLVNDGLDENCHNNGGQTWTYNQGVILGGLTELMRLTGDTSMLRDARQIAYSTIAGLSDSDLILTEKAPERDNKDLVQFKGIFIRNLALLNTALHDQHITMYIRFNAETAWQKAQDKRHLFDYFWQGPYVGWTGGSTGAALDLMNAAVY